MTGRVHDRAHQGAGAGASTGARADAQRDGMPPGGTHRTRWPRDRVLRGEHVSGYVHDFERGPVVDGEVLRPPPVPDMRGQRFGPGTGRARSRGLGEVTDQGGRPHRAAPPQQPPQHRRHFLGLVDDEMAERPGPIPASVVDGTASCPGARPPLGHARRHRLRVDQPGEAEAVEDVEGVRLFGAPFPVRLPLGALGDVGVGIAEQLGGLIEQRHVGRRPCGCGVGRAVQQVLLVLGQLGGGRGGGEPGGCGEQIGEQRLGGQPRPHGVDGRPDSLVGVQVGGDLLPFVAVKQATGKVRDHLVGEGGDCLPDKHPPGHVVRTAAAPCPGAGILDSATLKTEHGAVVGDVHIVCRDLLAGLHRLGHQPGHPQIPLEGDDAAVLVADGVDAGEQPARGRENHTRLTEGGQHLFDVTQENRARADHQEAGAGEPFPFGVEQIGGPVQGHRGLAGARSAVDDQDAGRVSADHRVLLGLQRRDDVVHTAGAGCGQGLQQRPVTA